MIKAYAAYKSGDPLQAFEYDPGLLGSKEVEIDVKFCGICHSDLSMIDNHWGMSSYPLVPGHEVVGVIATVGSEVTALQPGQNVGLGWHAKYCNQCSLCHSGDQNLCAQSTPTIVGHHGGFADKVRADANSVVPIPPGIALESAGPLFCGGITVFNPLIQFDIPPTAKVAVIGIGGLGHMALKFLHAWGCEVTAFTSSAAKRTEALSLGAHYTLNSRDSREIAQVAGKFDFIISTVNIKLDWNLYLSTLKAKGRLHFVGATLDPLDIGVFGLLQAQRQISGSPVGSPESITKMLEFVDLHNISPVIEKYKMADVNVAIAKLRANKAHYRIVLER